MATTRPCSFSESEKTHWARELFIKFVSIGARISTLALIILVGIFPLNKPSLLLFFISDFDYFES